MSKHSVHTKTSAASHKNLKLVSHRHSRTPGRDHEGHFTVATHSSSGREDQHGDEESHHGRNVRSRRFSANY